MTANSLNCTTALLVPVFNGERFIQSFHASIQALSGAFDEIIFYDDGSDDGSAAILKRLGYSVRQGTTNAGQAAARNRLLAATGADWVHFHDIDDLIHPSYLADTKRFLRE